MLDEILEFKQYNTKYYTINTTYCNQSGNKLGCSFCREYLCPFRLSYAQLSKDLSGIRRPLEIIAREAIYKGENIPNINAAKESTINWLNEFLSYEYLDEIYPNALPDEEKDDPKDLKKLKDKLYSFRARFQKSAFDDAFFEENDLFSCKLDKVIASALEKSTLKRYILIAHNNPWDDELKVRKRKKGNLKKNSLTAGEKDYLLKLTATFLIENTKNQQCIKITEADVLNWGINHNPPKNTDFYFETSGENVFKKEYVTNGEAPIKFRFNNLWISNFEIHDVTTKALNKKAMKYIDETQYCYYEDQGSGKPLKLCTPMKEDSTVE